MIKRMRVEPYSSYLERYRKGVAIIRSPSPTASSICPACRRSTPRAARSRRRRSSSSASACWRSSKRVWRRPARRLRNVIKCNVYCVPGPTHFATFNAVYDRYFPNDAPSRIFMFIHSWPGPFDLEIDCVAAL